MTNSDACRVLEGIDEGDQVEAWQQLIDTGLVWQLPSWYGRNAAALIAAGECRNKSKGVLR